MVCLGKCALEKNVYTADALYSGQLSHVGCLTTVWLIFSTTCFINYWEGGIKIFSYDYDFYLFFFVFWHILLFVFYSSCLYFSSFSIFFWVEYGYFILFISFLAITLPMTFLCIMYLTTVWTHSLPLLCNHCLCNYCYIFCFYIL